MSARGAGQEEGGTLRIHYVCSFPLAMLVFAIALTPIGAHAAAVSYSVTNTAGSEWRYDYTVVNDTLGVSLDEFTIYFDRTLYQNLVVAGSPVDWDSLVVQPDLALPDDGFFDSLALASGIAPSSALSGFSVSFNFLGQGIPGPQYFEIVDPITFAVLESGVTAVPAPSTGILLATGIVAAAIRRHRRAPQASAVTLKRR